MLQRGDDPAQVLDVLSRSLTNKLIHGPTQALNQAEGDERNEISELIARVFRLHPGE
jgi:glutamyl-tRNA reductase